MLFAQISNNDADMCTEMKSRAEACLTRVAWLIASCGARPGGLTPRLSVLRSRSQLWMLCSEDSTVRVDVGVASPLALLEAGMISIRGGGGGSGREGAQRRVGWLQALELPEYAERLQVLQDNQQTCN